ncbi:MAG: hypothetical protein KJ970_03030 [Candidatus Eisenbacteria bacterium]|uniref:Uncharacterized protein n=1 Tax=Eiseniibacteriota bacterium TaxID=2212470 RepID=A0A948W503_UNCEI|nr:hypothetical protein [Candidatus Eisenbacteria bacterium]MBU2689874.1 hypothetical protein [Candidatus Eisenbacteria bacterium]
MRKAQLIASNPEPERFGDAIQSRTEYKTERLLDVHLVTDEDIANQTCYAGKIGAASFQRSCYLLAEIGPLTSFLEIHPVSFCI